MADKIKQARVIHKHDVEARWNFAINFIPKAGEIIVYDRDENHSYERFKIGDGKTTVVNLPFAAEAAVLEMFSMTEGVGVIDGGEIATYIF